jgi:hypothetical protein
VTLADPRLKVLLRFRTLLSLLPRGLSLRLQLSGARLLSASVSKTNALVLEMVATRQPTPFSTLLRSRGAGGEEEGQIATTSDHSIAAVDGFLARVDGSNIP